MKGSLVQGHSTYTPPSLHTWPFFLSSEEWIRWVDVMRRPTHHQVNCWDSEISLTDNSIIIYCFMQLFDPCSSVSPEITPAQTSEISVQYLHALVRLSQTPGADWSLASEDHIVLYFKQEGKTNETEIIIKKKTGCMKPVKFNVQIYLKSTACQDGVALEMSHAITATLNQSWRQQTVKMKESRGGLFSSRNSQTHVRARIL